jgi:hypothetical protein
MCGSVVYPVRVPPIYICDGFCRRPEYIEIRCSEININREAAIEVPQDECCATNDVNISRYSATVKVFSEFLESSNDVFTGE